MAKIRFLHLSDFHAGLGEQRRRYPLDREKVIKDIQKATRGEPVDVVLFTGDLTQRGTREEFELFDAEMGRLLDALPGSKCPALPDSKRPALLAVPGNHDLMRPNADLSTTKQMSRPWTAEEYHAQRKWFWAQSDPSAWSLVKDAFEHYRTWWDKNIRTLPKSITVHQGSLPGDFSATINVGGYIVGIVGLNSAWRQLTPDDFEGRLDVDLRQLESAIAGDLGDWFKTRHITLLMTHHPPTWLSEQSREEFLGTTAAPGRFTAHLFGHQHVAKSLSVAQMGLPTVEWLQAPSLFGLEEVKSGITRVMGYSVLEFSDESGTHRRRFWPRHLSSVGETQVLNPDASFALDEDNAVTSPFKPHFEVATSKQAAHVTTPSSTTLVRPPGGPFDRELYISRPKIEREALLRLQSQGRPVVLFGNQGAGRTWLLQAIQHEWRKTHSAGRSARLSFRSLGLTALTQLDYLVYAVAEQVAEQLDVDLDSPSLEALHPSKPQRSTPMTRLKRFFLRDILPQHELVLLALDDVDVIPREWRNDFYGGLRSWMEDDLGAPIHKLRLLLSVSTTPSKLIEGDSRSLFNLSTPIAVDPLRDDEIDEMARRIGISLPRETISSLARTTQGLPLQVAEALYELSKPR